MSYVKLKQHAQENKSVSRKEQRKLWLYGQLWRDIAILIKVLVPGNKTDKVLVTTRTLVINLIELRTGKRIKLDIDK